LNTTFLKLEGYCIRFCFFWTRIYTGWTDEHGYNGCKSRYQQRNSVVLIRYSRMNLQACLRDSSCC